MISPKGSKREKTMIHDKIQNSNNKYYKKTQPIFIEYKTNNDVTNNNNNVKPIQKVKSIDRDIFNPGSSPANNSFMEKLNYRALTY